MHPSLDSKTEGTVYRAEAHRRLHTGIGIDDYVYLQRPTVNVRPYGGTRMRQFISILEQDDHLSHEIHSNRSLAGSSNI